MKSEESVVLSKLSLYIIMPCTILNAFQIDVTDEVRNGMLFAFGVAILLQIGMILAGILLKRIAHLDVVEEDSVIYSNAGNLVIPLVSAVLGQEWVIYASAFVSVQLFFLWSHGVSGFLGSGKIQWKKILLNINMLAVFAGIGMLLTGLRMPQFAVDVCSSVSAMLAPAAMLVTGMIVGGMQLSEVFQNKRIYLVCFLRLILIPVFILLLFWLFHVKNWVPNAGQILLVTFFAVITPAASSITQFAQVYEKDAAYAGAINIVSTLFCIVTMPLMAAVYQMI
jgi:predicted permease